MPSRHFLAAALAATLVGGACADSWLCQDPENEQRIVALEATQRKLTAVIRHLKKQQLQESFRAEQELQLTRRELEELQQENARLRAQLAALTQEAPSTWSDTIQDLRRNGDVVVGLNPILERLERVGRPTARLRRRILSLARFDGLLEAALEAPAPEDRMARLSELTDGIEHFADRMAAELVERLESFEAELGSEFSPASLPRDDFGGDLGEDDLGESFGGVYDGEVDEFGLDFGEF